MDSKKMTRFRSDSRRTWMYYSEERAACKSNARVGYGKYQCSKCMSIVGPKMIDIDHIVKVTPPQGLKVREDIPPFITRLWCPLEGLTALCKSCHLEKTKAERSVKRKTKRKKR